MHTKRDKKFAIFLSGIMAVLLGLTSIAIAGTAEQEEKPQAKPVSAKQTEGGGPLVGWALVKERLDQATSEYQLAKAIEYVRWVKTIEYAAAVERARQEERDHIAAQKAARAKKAAAAQEHRSPVAPRSDVWWGLAGCETGGKYDNPNTGNGYFGYFQFDLQTWQSVGGPGYPHHHSYDTQLVYAKKLQANRGWSPWPYCSKKLGLR